MRKRMASSSSSSSCSLGKNGCVAWVEKYFKDCVCDVRTEVSFGLGLVSLICWGIAEIPQIVTNFQTKPGHGVSLALLLTWVVGDIFNLVGCLLEPVTLPTQYYTALLYTTTTVVLLIQTLYYDYFVRWWKRKSFGVTSEVQEERKASTPKREDPTEPIPTTASSISTPQTDVYYRSARSLANSGSSPYGAYYLGSGPSRIGGAAHDDSSDEEAGSPPPPPKASRAKRITSRSVGYGTFILGSASLPFQAKGFMDASMFLYANNVLQGTVMKEIEANPFGRILGWIMAAIYMGGRLPQIYLNIKRGNVEGLNPLMFIFALIANATYVGSILVRSVELDRIKANAPWLLDAIVCVLLDLLIIIQFAYYKIVHKRAASHEDSYGGYESVEKSTV
ncbi:putative vacuolar amino acid transporter YPQ1 [Iris pallida]|uniref:Vacuolar amino acid transporter YPQ1 n=1 Tax=Iris pallida TaxID=29817 RepID=A0AAX6GFZ2_IRIPA|nr:putative vacuolar amino acid transporter YPQ1 [Iris pallida]